MKNLKQMAMELHEEARRQGLEINCITFDIKMVSGLDTWPGLHRIDTVRIDAEVIEFQNKEQAE